MSADVAPLSNLVAAGTSVQIEGELRRTPEGTKQVVEVHARKVLDVGPCDAAVYPIAKTKLSLEFLRSVMHLRARTNTVRLRCWPSHHNEHGRLNQCGVVEHLNGSHTSEQGCTGRGSLVTASPSDSGPPESQKQHGGQLPGSLVYAWLGLARLGSPRLGSA